MSRYPCNECGKCHESNNNTDRRGCRKNCRPVNNCNTNYGCPDVNQNIMVCQGQQGVQGIRGSTGPQGNQGAQGNQGPQGAAGTQGSQGAQGAQGNQGFQGFQGFQGIQGNQGNQGVQGTQGLRGFQGTVGVQGTQGLRGFQGFQGFQGTQGSQGTQGNIGVQGTVGVQGTQGFQGSMGSVLIPFSTGTMLSGATVVSASPILMGFGGYTVETVDGLGESTIPPEVGGFSFPVPLTGVISNLQISTDLLVASVTSINTLGLQYDFTVSKSGPTNDNGINQATPGYLTTGLTSSVRFGFPNNVITSGTFQSATNINVSSLPVTKGDRIGIRIRTLSNTDPSAADISQLSFSGSLTYTPTL